MATALLEGDEGPQLLSAAPAAGRALELGLVVEFEEMLQFVDADLRNEFLIQHTVARVLERWDLDVDFSPPIERLQHRAAVLNIDAELAPKVLLALQSRNRDVLGRVAEIALIASSGDQRNRAFWSLYHPFCEALPELDPDPASLPEVLQPILDAVAEDLTNGLIHSAVRNLAGRSREKAEALAAAFLNYAGDRARSLAGDALLALAEFDLEEAHRRALALTEEADSVLQRTGILVVGNLPYPEENDPLRRATFERLAALRHAVLPEADHALPSAYGGLLPHAEAREGLVDLARRRDAAVQYGISVVLMRNPDEAPLPWFGESLMRMGRAAPSLEHSLTLFDSALAKRAAHDPVSALAVLEEWTVAGGLHSPEDAGKLPDTFPATFHRLREHAREPLQDAITRWWASRNQHLYEAAWQVVGGHDFATDEDRRLPLALSSSVLSSMDEATVRLVLFHVMGYVIGGRPLSMLLVSALRRDPCSPSLAAFVTEALADVALYTYPGDASEYLDARLAATDLSEIEGEVIRVAKERAEEYFSARTALHGIAELQPPAHRVALLRREQAKHHTEIMEAARSRSAFLQLVQRVPLKYGRGFSVQRAGEMSAPTPLNSFSYEAELPRAPFIDPVGEAARRVRWQTMGTDEEPIQANHEEEGS